jgi:hypothetical protein
MIVHKIPAIYQVLFECALARRQSQHTFYNANRFVDFFPKVVSLVANNKVPVVAKISLS